MKKILVACGIAALALSSCTAPENGSSPENTNNDTITIGLTYIPDVQFAPYYVAEQKGYFKEEGLNIELRHHGPQESLMGALQSGAEDVVVAGGDEIAQARSTGVNVYSWATLYQEYPVKLLVADSSVIATAKDIKGATIGLPGEYGENYYALLAMLSENGLTMQDVTVKYIGYTQAQALATGQVDAVIGFANSDAVAIQSQGVPVRMVDPVDGGLPLIGVSMGSLDSFKKDTTEREEKILSALEKSVEYMRHNREETLDIVEKYVQTLADPSARATATKVLDATLNMYGNKPLGSQDPDKWSAMLTFMEKANLLQTRVNASDFYVLVR